MARRDRFRIATQNGYVDGSFTRSEVRKELAAIVKDDAEACRARYRRCSVIGTARSGNVEIRIGGRQGANMWQRYVVNKVS